MSDDRGQPRDLGPKDVARRRPSTRRPTDRKVRPPRPPRKSGSGGRIWLRIVVWTLVLALMGTAAWLWWRNNMSFEDDIDFDDLTMSEPVAELVVGDRSVVLVFPEWDATGYVTEERRITSRDRPGEDLLGMMRGLCRGPQISGAISALPDGTEALAAFYNPETAAVVLEFSQDLVVGHPGGSAAEAATLTSILRTVALNFPQARSCVILVAGGQVETLAGHLNLERSFDLRRWL